MKQVNDYDFNLFRNRFIVVVTGMTFLTCAAI